MSYPVLEKIVWQDAESVEMADLIIAVGDDKRPYIVKSRYFHASPHTPSKPASVVAFDTSKNVPLERLLQLVRDY